MVKIKICGLSRLEDIDAVNICKPDYIGFVFAKSRRQISIDKAKELKQALSEDIKAVGVFVNEDNEKIIELLNQNVVDIAQLHGNESENDIIEIKAATGKQVIKAVSVESETDILEWNNSTADFLLLDNGGGGTGKSFDWANIPEFGKPYFLAGGICADNIDEAVKKCPYAIDLSGGAETNGFKDAEKIEYLVKRVRANN